MFTNETFAEEYIKNIVGKGYVLKKVYNNIEIDPYDTKKGKYILYTIQKGCSNFVKKITVIYKFLVLGEKNMNNNQHDDYSELIRFISKFRDRKLNICSKKKIIENKIEVKIEPKNENFKIGTNMFKGCKNITVIDLSNCNNKNVTNMSGMFYGCSSLTTINFCGIDTSNVTDMSYMFCRCVKLTNINFGDMDTSKVKDMAYMFSECSSLKELDLSKFNTQNVKDISFMFKNCYSLKKLNIFNFNTKNVNSISCIFTNCTSLKKGNITYNEKNMENLMEIINKLHIS